MQIWCENVNSDTDGWQLYKQWGCKLHGADLFLDICWNTVYSEVDGAIVVLKLNVAVSARMRAKRWTRGKVNKSDEWDWGLGVVQEATAWWRDINTEKDRPEKSHVNGGNTNGLSSQKEKCKKDRKMNKYLAVKANFLNPPSSTSRKTICALFQYNWQTVWKILTPSKWPWNPTSSMDL